MYLPRPLLSKLYTSLLARTHPLSPPILLLVALTPDALCAARILTALLKRDYIPHKVQPVSGYTELAAAGQNLVQPLTRQRGGDGGVVVCLGAGGLVDLEEVLGLDFRDEDAHIDHGVEVWVLDARRPWNLQNVFGSGGQVVEGTGTEVVRKIRGVENGRIGNAYQPGRGGVVVFDDGDIEAELSAEKEAFCALMEMPELGDDQDFGGEDSDHVEDSDDEEDQPRSRKRKSSGGDEGDNSESDTEGERPRRRRRSNSVGSFSLCMWARLTTLLGLCHTILAVGRPVSA